MASFGRRLIVGPEHARREFTRLLEQARRSIAIVDPKLTDPAILDLLKVKRKAGVAVTVLGREHVGGLTPHGKMVIVDGAIAVIGSMSLSALSLDFRREVAVIVRDRALVGRDEAGVRAPGRPDAGRSRQAGQVSLRLPRRRAAASRNATIVRRASAGTNDGADSATTALENSAKPALPFAFHPSALPRS